MKERKKRNEQNDKNMNLKEKILLANYRAGHCLGMPIEIFIRHKKQLASPLVMVVSKHLSMPEVEHQMKMPLPSESSFHSKGISSHVIEVSTLYY